MRGRVGARWRCGLWWRPEGGARARRGAEARSNGGAGRIEWGREGVRRRLAGSWEKYLEEHES
jgi:hypothetical protein